MISKRRVYEARFIGQAHGDSGGLRQMRQITTRVIGDSPEAAERVLRQEYKYLQGLVLVPEAPDHKGEL